MAEEPVRVEILEVGEQGMLIYWCYSAGQLCVAKGELQMASDSFKIVLDEDGNNFPALLGQVIFFRLLDTFKLVLNFSCGGKCLYI